MRELYKFRDGVLYRIAYDWVAGRESVFIDYAAYYPVHKTNAKTINAAVKEYEKTLKRENEASHD